MIRPTLRVAAAARQLVLIALLAALAAPIPAQAQKEGQLRVDQTLIVPEGGEWYADGHVACRQQVRVEKFMRGRWVPVPNARVRLAVIKIPPGAEVWSDPNEEAPSYVHRTDARGTASREWYTVGPGEGEITFDAVLLDRPATKKPAARPDRRRSQARIRPRG